MKSCEVLLGACYAHGDLGTGLKNLEPDKSWLRRIGRFNCRQLRRASDNTVTEAEEAKLEDCAGSKCWETTGSDLEASTEGEEWGASIEDEEEGLELRGG